MIVLLPILTSLIPQIGAIVAAIVSLRKQYPGLTPEQIQDLVKEITSQSDVAFDSVLAQIAADQAAHPVAPK